VAFIAGWVIAGAWTPGYSPVRQAISQLAQIGAPHRVIMTVGFVVYGLGIVVFGRWLGPLAGSRPVAWCLALTGLATLGVAACPLTAAGASTQDHLHAAFAAVGYVSLAATPVFAARAWARSGRRVRAALSVLTGIGSAVALAATLTGVHTGLLQRLGLTVLDVWLVAMATSPPEVRPSYQPGAGRKA
jgi:hypothetical membrane protein